MGICRSSNDKNNAKLDNLSDINIDNYNCKFDKEELNRKLNYFVNQTNIQDLANIKNDNSDDSVYQLIKKEENEELTKFFDKIKISFMKDIDGFLFAENINNLYPLVSQIISNENGNEIHKTKIKKQIAKIKEDENLFKINHLTILLTGKSGTGKSTLINVLLNLPKGLKAPTGVGNYITTETKPYQSKNRSYLRLVDTRGIELNVDYGPNEVDKECKRFIKSELQTNDINNFIHCIWYCITGNRLEECEMQLLNSLRNTFPNSKIPIIMVYTQSTDDDIIKQMKDFIKNNNIEGDFIDILALPKSTRGITLSSYNLDKLVVKTIKKVKEALNGDMKNIMINNISEYIKNNLWDENSRIKNKINETTILNLIRHDKVQNEGEFQNTLINTYGTNINFFFKNKTMNKNTILDIQNSYLIKNKNDYFNYTQKYEENIISNDLSRLAYKFLDIQAKKEILKGKSTKPKNKRCHKDFINTNKNFLLNNLDYISQKHYYNYIIPNSCNQLSEAFEHSLNNTVVNLLNKEEIKDLISKCFYNKYEQFEKRVKDMDSKINTYVSQNNQEEDDYIKPNNPQISQDQPKNESNEKQSSEFEKEFNELPSFTTRYD